MSGTRLIPANTTLLQPGSRYFRISDALNYQAQAVTTSNAQTASQITALQSQVASLQSQVATLQGQVTPLQQFMNSFNYQQVEISTHTVYLDQRTIYRRSFVIPGNVLNTINSVGSYAHTIPSLAYIITIQGILSQQQGNGFPLTFAQTAQVPIANAVAVWGDTTNLYFSIGNTAFGTYTTVVTMWYTATDR